MREKNRSFWIIHVNVALDKRRFNEFVIIKDSVGEYLFSEPTTSECNKICKKKKNIDYIALTYENYCDTIVIGIRICLTAAGLVRNRFP